MSNTLTAKEEHFSTLILEGSTQQDAYVKAYDVSPDTLPSSISEQASVLANTLKISTRIQELRDNTVSPKIATLIRRKEHATEVMDDTNTTRQVQLNANRLIGDYEGNFVKKLEIDVSIEQKALILRLEARSIEELGVMLDMVEAKMREEGQETTPVLDS